MTARAMTILFFIYSIMVSAVASACTCGRPDKEFVALPSRLEKAEYLYNKADVILKGVVVRIDAVRRPADLAAARRGDERSVFPHLVAQIEVSEQFKGPAGVDRIYSHIGGAACAGPLLPGEPYYYLATLDKHGRPWVNSCFYSRYVYPLWSFENLVDNILDFWRQLNKQRSSVQ